LGTNGDAIRFQVPDPLTLGIEDHFFYKMIIAEREIQKSPNLNTKVQQGGLCIELQ
jgi:hypothetical protein